MAHVIPAQLPWWVAGPGVGLCVVALYALAGVKLGVSGGWLQLLRVLERRPPTEAWRLWFTGSLVVGAFLAAALGAGRVTGYGALSRHLPAAALVVVLLLVGVLVGYGARWAGGCTSGHGISGCSAGSPESLAATGTFFAVAIVVTLVVHLVSAGAV
ncbi:MAG TPA: YeeE/YedE thiosulfate transporter family protein [Marmoricola sp.]|nr:YeeE/YedE thiosulfate transporter family protein [Marmoricola sp.]